jgi:hypothetical protein
MNAHLPALAFDSGATFSPDGLYRYHLWRLWGDREHRCVFVGLNPSTADAARDDPTIRKCAGFAKRWGFGAVDVVNVFAWRSTKPVGILRAADPVGPDNDEAIAHVLEGASRVVWAWGQHSTAVRRLVKGRLSVSAQRWVAIPKACNAGILGRALDGSPRHPLMLPYSARFEPGAA